MVNEQGLAATGLSVAFEGRAVVRDVAIRVGPGEVVGLLGPNGAGKTTTFRLIAGLIKGQGKVTLNGCDLHGMPLWRRVTMGLGYLAQQPTVFRHLTVFENIMVPVEARKADAAEARRWLSQLGLNHLADAPAGRLSGGERRRLEIARCMAGNAKIVLLDEPFSGIDPVTIEELQKVIADLAAGGVGVLVTDHAVRETLSICDRAVILDGGAVMAEGVPEDVSINPHVIARYLGSGFDLKRPV